MRVGAVRKRKNMPQAKILLVDNCADIRALLADTLEDAGYGVRP